jgi:hypothetical protein
MPYLIMKKKNVDEENAFYKKCGNAGFIPVICTIKGRKADIYADVHALENQHDEVRQKILADQSVVSKIGQEVFDRFNPKAKSWSFGYYSDIQGVDADIAQEMSAILAGELDAFIMNFCRGS